MTTSITVKVTGRNRAIVSQENRIPVTVEGDYNGGTGEQVFTFATNSSNTMTIKEEAVPDNETIS